ncbi:olfactory receptor 4K3-like [Microtus pennsylvanicus]|uniref:olfactory receptor 4K3-like n=1 Tax=Microtus pennsylvanicus TaxID=10058 RepID=UPI003F6C2469
MERHKCKEESKANRGDTAAQVKANEPRATPHEEKHQARLLSTCSIGKSLYERAAKRQDDNVKKKQYTIAKGFVSEIVFTFLFWKCTEYLPVTRTSAEKSLLKELQQAASKQEAVLNSYNGRRNQSIVSEFVLLGLSHSEDIQVPLFIIFLMFYLLIVLGNIVIMFLITTDRNLHSPMYFFLANLSFVDMWLSSVTTPKMIADVLRENKTISFAGCMSQVFFAHCIGAGEMVLLVVMAYDRYVAICKPLHYLTIMNLKRCVGLVLTSWTIGFVHALSQLVAVLQLPLCGPMEIDSFFCDIPLVINLACMDSNDLDSLVNADCGVVIVTCFILLLMSYTYILFTVQRSSNSGASKALSTCSAHITVVMIFFVPCIFIYVWPLNITWLDKFLAVFYSVFAPLLNPAIYTLRNKEMRNSMKRLKSYFINNKVNI